MTRYRIVGLPLLPLQHLEDYQIGEEFDATIDAETEQDLINRRAIVVVESAKPKQESRPEKQEEVSASAGETGSKSGRSRS